MKSRIVALIPMRHNSERVPGKNYRIFAGQPLFHCIVKSLLRCDYVEEIVIDTDSPVIMKNVSEKTYLIGDTEKLTGVSQRSLRSWEGKHIAEPSRIPCGLRSYRRYSEMDIKLIKRIKEY